MQGTTNIKIYFFLQISGNAQISYFMKIRQVGAELFRADRQTDITKQIVASCNFCERA